MIRLKQSIDTFLFLTDLLIFFKGSVVVGKLLSCLGQFLEHAVMGQRFCYWLGNCHRLIAILAEKTLSQTFCKLKGL
jgi:hypothetical protein